MFNIQRPATWLFNAFGIISGGAPQRMWEEVNPVVDIVQGGLGLEVVRTFGVFNNNPGPAFANPIPIEDAESHKFAYLLRVSGVSIDTANTFFEGTYSPVGGPGEIRVLGKTVGPGESFSFGSINSGQPYVYIPPGCFLTLALGAFTGVGLKTSVNWELVRLLRGTKPW